MRRWYVLGVFLILGAWAMFEGYREELQGFYGGAKPDDPRLIAIIDVATRSADDFVALANQSPGNPPRQSDPKVGALLDAVLHTSALTAEPRPSVSEDLLMRWAGATEKVNNIYLLAGTGLADIRGANQQDPVLMEKITANTVLYAPEVGQCLDAQFRLFQALVEDVLARDARDPEPDNPKVKAGLEKMRGGLTLMLTGSVANFTLPGITDDWRRQRLMALTAFAPTAAGFLLPEQKRLVRDASIEVSRSMGDPEVQVSLIAFAEKFAEPAGRSSSTSP